MDLPIAGKTRRNNLSFPRITGSLSGPWTDPFPLGSHFWPANVHLTPPSSFFEWAFQKTLTSCGTLRGTHRVPHRPPQTKARAIQVHCHGNERISENPAPLEENHSLRGRQGCELILGRRSESEPGSLGKQAAPLTLLNGGRPPSLEIESFTWGAHPAGQTSPPRTSTKGQPESRLPVSLPLGTPD